MMTKKKREWWETASTHISVAWTTGRRSVEGLKVKQKKKKE
jgi:hypothetical protein